jgi:hypothetical protein
LRHTSKLFPQLTGQRFKCISGDDDYFSSDLSDTKLTDIWGKVCQPVLVVPSGKDEYVPSHINVEHLIERWKGFCQAPGGISALSGLIPEANHTVDQPDSQEWIATRVVKFLEELGNEQKF